MKDKDKLIMVQEIVAKANESLHTAKQILNTLLDEEDTNAKSEKSSSSMSVVEGIFDGERMAGDDGNQYNIPENYASKSRLVKGDRLKLTISEDGSHVFKQTSPVVRKRIVGKVVDQGGYFTVVAEGKSYKVLIASITFYKLREGDNVSILIPEEGESDWAAIENKIGGEASESAPESVEEESIQPAEEPLLENESIAASKEEALQENTNLPVEETPIITQGEQPAPKEVELESQPEFSTSPAHENELIADVLDRPSKNINKEETAEGVKELDI